MTRPGRALRFLVTAIGAWVAIRIGMLWPVAPPAPRIADLSGMATVPEKKAGTTAATATATEKGTAVPASKGKGRAVARAPALLGKAGFRSQGTTAPNQWVARAPILDGKYILGGGRVQAPSSDRARIVPAPLSASDGDIAAAGRRWRWSASAWLFVRDGGAAIAGLSGGQLGGSQAGVRIGYAIDAARRLVLYGRYSTPLRQPGAEAAIGLDWRPTTLPIRLIAEHRLPQTTQGGGPTIGIVGGVGPTPLPLKFSLEGYGQAGLIVRDQGIGFADGAVRVARRIGHIGDVKLSIGAGAWGAIQPDAARLDLGPTIGINLPVKGRSLRLNIDWRQRVAGQARPASGPTLTLGADF